MKQRIDANGLHVIERSSGLNLLFHTDAPRDTWARASRFVSVALLNACDLSCSFCYAPKTAGRLGNAELFAWLAELDREGTMGIGLGGGEPTLRRDLPDICSWANDNTRVALTMTTHGHHFTPALGRALRRRVHFVRVSVDATGDLYERIRGRPFSDLLRAIEVIAGVCPFGINMVVNADTISEIDSVAHFAKSVGAAELLLLPEAQTARTRGIDSDTMAALAVWVRANPKTIRLAMSAMAASDAFPTAHPFNDRDQLVAYSHIAADGTLKATSFSRAGVKIGSSVVAALDELRNAQGS